MRYLKIKDNVNLEELEKFGFFDGFGGYESILEGDHCLIMEDNRRLCIDQCSYCGKIENLTLIYDLIKADMVEVVEGKEGN